MEHSQPDGSELEQSRQLDRNAARPLPPRPSPSHIDPADRRRRLTTPEQSAAYPYGMAPGSRYHSLTNHMTQQQQRHEDLAARVLPQFRPRQNSPTMSDIVPNVSQWQPDEDVQKCPVCERDFTLFFRKHHCRKCGKVVCGDCSRHRITVPVRYIAQPPWAAESAFQYASSAAPVRVCNPCVPDPWSPPDNEQPPPVPPPDTRPRSHYRYSLPPPATSAHPGHVHRHSTDSTRPPPYRQFDTPTSPQPGHVTYRRLLPPGPTQNSAEALPRARSIAVTPRREIKEEDECPVCGIELPPGEATREAHVASCVMTRFGSLDTPRSSPAAGDVGRPEASSSDPTAPNRLRAQSYRSRGLYQYKATEKDCVDGGGEEQECPICFEEFQPGETLGRLECLCRFHHKCIREWWVRRGPGMCPVHASHE